MASDSDAISTDDMSVSHLAQFNALRDEIIKRAEFEHQLIALTLAAAGTLAAVGLASDGSYLALLVYPLLTCFISISWLFNNFRIQQMGHYIRKKLEPACSGLGWEQFLKSPDSNAVRPDLTGVWREWLSPKMVPIGIFSASPLVFVILALSDLLPCWTGQQAACPNPGFAGLTATGLVVVDFGLIIITTLVILRYTVVPQEQSKQPATSASKNE